MASEETATPAAGRDADRTYFTVEGANQALPYVRRIIEDVTGTYQQIVDLRRRLERVEPGQDASLERSYEQAMDRLSSLVDELHEVGVELKDFERGLVDFPAWHDGREVLLCWKQGEDAVAYWHETDAGYAGRQKVELLQKAAR